MDPQHGQLVQKGLAIPPMPSFRLLAVEGVEPRIATVDPSSQEVVSILITELVRDMGAPKSSSTQEVGRN